MSVQTSRRLFTTAEYHQMAAAGILAEEDRLELLQGEIVEMSPLGSRHVACVNRLTQCFTARLGPKGIVSVQNPVRLGDFSEPEPDVTLLRWRDDFYAEALPGGVGRVDGAGAGCEDAGRGVPVMGRIMAAQARDIAEFLGVGLDLERMAGTCDRRLYRQREVTA